MEYKAFPSFTKQIEGRLVTGIAAVMGNVDDGHDRILPGAFKKTLKENRKRVRHLWMHDAWAPPTAAIKDLREVGRDDLPEDVRKRYPEASGGLQVAREYLDTPRGNEILAALAADPPAINEMSFAYDAVKVDFEEEQEGQPMVRNLRELRLFDTSDVNWGMNAATVASKRAVPLSEADVLEAVAWLHGRASDDERLQEAAANLRWALVRPQMGKAGPAGQRGIFDRPLSVHDLERLKGALDALHGILLTAEPPDEEPKRRALTVMRRLQFAERELYLYQQ